MAPQPELGVVSERPGNFPVGEGALAAPQAPPVSQHWLALVLAAFGLFLATPLAWGLRQPALWSPVTGLGMVLVGWLGWRRAAGPLAGATVLLLIWHVLRGPPEGEAASSWLLWMAVEAALAPAAPALAWVAYHTLAGSKRELADPRSAMQFVLLVPGAALFLVSAMRLLAALLLGPGAWQERGVGLLLVDLWLELALGALVVAPPLLVLGTPMLVRAGLLPLEAGADGPVADRSDPLRAGDWLEIAGLALGAALLCLLLSRLHGRELLGWQLWGMQLLLIVWAAARQGLRGGALVASASALAPLLVLPLWPQSLEGPLSRPLLQAHFAAQCCAALLVASASAWARQHEISYRRIASQVPVVIYSARFARRAGGRDRPEITLVSAASRSLLGRSAEQLLGEHDRWLACVHPEDRELLLAAIEQLDRQHQPVSCEYRLTAPGDEPSVAGRTVPAPPARAVRWARDVLAPTRDREGRLIGWEGVVTDITEQRLLADDLRRTTSMFHALVGNLPAGVFFVQGPHGQPSLVNARARQLLGQREDPSAGLEHLPQTYRLFRSGGGLYPAEELPVYQALRYGRTVMKDDIVVHRPDGRRVPLVTWAAPVQLGQREAPAAVWVLEDWTALHQAEAARKDSEARLRALIETMAEGLLVQTAQGTIVTCNHAATHFFGAPPDRLVGRPLADLGWALLDETGQPLSWEEHPSAQALRTGRPVRNVVCGLVRQSGLRAAGPSGSLANRWALSSAVPLAQQLAGGVGGVVTTFSDISAYVHAREAIRASEERYRGLVESLPVMLLLCDLQMHVTYVNPATTAITGYPVEELADPSSWRAIVHPEDLPRAIELGQSALAGQTARGELRYRARDGSEKASFLISQPRYQEGAIVGTLVLMMDVTRERQLERELQRSQRLELIGRLSSGVAHDFNNLLGIVLNLADLARQHLPADHPVNTDLRRISEASEQAAGLAAQLLRLSKQRAAPARRLDLNEVTRRTLELLGATLPASIQLQADLAPEDLPIRADETQVQQVLMNLCLNGRDAMPHGGTLSVTTRRGPDATVALTVADTGSGMSEEVRGRIFEPFFSTKDTGTGLGLAVVQQIIESQGGTVEVQSEPGQGTRFEVRWPACAD